MAGKAKNKVTRLEDLVVEEVSIVDKPANQRPFLVVKNKDGKAMADKGKEIQRDENGNLVTKNDDGKGQPQPTEPVDLAKAFADMGLAIVEVDEKGAQLIEKRLSISSSQRTEIFRSLGDAMRRASTAMTMVDFADTDSGEGGSTLVPVLAQEFSEVGKAFADAAKSLGKSSTKKNDDNEDPIETQINSLIENVEAEIVEKRGMSKGRLDRFKQAIGVLNGVLNELSSGKAAGGDGATTGKPGASDDADKKRDKTKKNDDGDTVTLQKNVEELTNSVSKLTGIIERQNKEIVTLKKARPVSNVIGAGQRQDVKKNEDVDDTKWGLDLNDEKDRENVDKAINFHET